MTEDVLGSLDRRELAAVIERHAEGVRATATELSEQIESGSEPSAAQAGAVRTELEEFASVVEAVVGDEEAGDGSTSGVDGGGVADAVDGGGPGASAPDG